MFLVMFLDVSHARGSLLSAGLATGDKNIVQPNVVHLGMSFQEKLLDRNLKKPLKPNLIIVIAADATDRT